MVNVEGQQLVAVGIAVLTVLGVLLLIMGLRAGLIPEKILPYVAPTVPAIYHPLNRLSEHEA